MLQKINWRNITFLILTVFISGKNFAQPNNEIAKMLNLTLHQPDSLNPKTFHKIGVLFNRSAEYDSAIFYFKKEYNAASSLESKSGMLSAYNGYIDVYINQAKYEQAIKTCLEGIALAEKYNNRKYAGAIRRSAGYINMIQDRYKDALVYYEQAYKDLLAAADTLAILNLCPDIGGNYGKMGDTARGLYYYDLGLKMGDAYIKDKKLNTYDSSVFMNKLVNIVYNVSPFNNRPELYRKYLLVAENIWNTIKYRSDEIYAYTKLRILSVLTDLYYKTGEYQKSVEYAQMGIEKLRDIPEVFTSSDIYLTLSQAYGKLGRYREAYLYLDSQTHFRDSIFNSDKRVATISAEMKFGEEQKNQQMKLLRKERDNQRLVAISTALGLMVLLVVFIFMTRSAKIRRKLLETEKEVQIQEQKQKMLELEQVALRAQMNPHFIFNSLNSVQRFVLKNDINGVNQYLSTFASLIRQTLENSGKQSIKLKDEIAYLKTYLTLEQMRNNNRFEFEILVSPLIETEEFSVPGMILQPYLENAISHGLSEDKGTHGFIRLSVHINNRIICEIEDNGPGIKNSLLKKEYSGTVHHSLGNEITMKRIDAYNQMNNWGIEVSVQDKSETGAGSPGTKVTISFPVNKC